MRGFGLPGWGRGVTVPASMKPKPNAAERVDMVAVLVHAGGQSDGIGKLESHHRDRQRRHGLADEAREAERVGALQLRRA